MPSGSTASRLRLALIALGAFSALASLLVPLAPVQQQMATFSWPVDGSTAPVGVQLFPYHPESLTARFSCETVGDVARRMPRGTVFATAPSDTPEGRHDGLVVEVSGDTLLVTSRGRVLLTEPVGSTTGCAWRLNSDSSVTEITRDGVRMARLAEDLRPQVVGVFSDLDPAQDGTTGLSVQIRSDTRFQTSPTPWKHALMGLAILGLVAALGALRRLDRRAETTTARVAPRGWWRPRLPDLLVVGVLGVWAVIGPFTVDDGYILTQVKARRGSGFVGNYYRWFNAPEAPFGFFYDLFYVWGKVSRSLLWMRVPALLAGVTSWLLVSRLVLPALGEGPATSRGVRWVAAVAFLAAWMPYDSGLRPEPFVVLGTLATLCAVERTLASERLLPLALGVIAAVATVAVTPTGVIALLPLLVAPRRLAAVIWDRRDLRWAPLAAVLLASGLSVLTLMFYDQTLGAVVEATRVRNAITPGSWDREVLRYGRLLDPLSPEGSFARRMPVLLLVGGLVLVTATLLRNRRVPGVERAPAQRLLLVTGLAFAVISATPTKWTHHFGAFAGLAAAVLALTAWTTATELFRSTRPRAVALVGLSGVLALSLAAANHWWWVSVLDPPWRDERISVLGVPVHTPLVVVTVLVCLMAVVLAGWREARGRPPRPSRLPPPSVLLAVGLCLSVAIQLVTFLVAPVEQRRTYSIAEQNVKSVLSSSCGLADSVMIEESAQAGALFAAPGGLGSAEPGIFERNGGFAPEHPPLHRFGTEGLVFDVPVWGSRVGERTDGATGTARSGWYQIGDRLGAASAPLVIAVAGRTHGGNRLAVELGRRRGDRVDRLETIEVDEFAHRHRNRIDAALNRLPVDTPSWRDIRIDVRDKLPPDADVLRVVATDGSVGTGGWLAFSAPRAPVLRTLTDAVGGDAAVVLDWPVGAAYPCVQPATLALGEVQMPQWRIAAALSSLGDTAFAKDHAGPFAPSVVLADQVELPTYLANDWNAEAASVFRIDAPPLGRPTVSLGRRVEWGWSARPHLVIPGIDDVGTVE
ncbi:MAG TPA: arabinosyltransferase domain-containing protein [Acidimicrobiales bacterium]|nr:arabinosyltransferase domain-containing protein [Acidimicrobiales bacterium]